MQKSDVDYSGVTKFHSLCVFLERNIIWNGRHENSMHELYIYMYTEFPRILVLFG
jgi:hypothetical protein